MSFNLKNALALLTPHEQAAIFAHLAESLHQSDLRALAKYYERVLKEKSSTTDDTAAPAKAYLASEEQRPEATNRVRETIASHGTLAASTSKISSHYEELYATFDGEVLKPEARLNLPRDKRYRLLIDKDGSELSEIKVQAFKKIAARAVSMGIKDFAEQHDHYLYSTPKTKSNHRFLSTRVI